MRLFKQTPEDYYNAPYAEFPALIRGTVVVVMAILWAFSKLMWRWKVEDADLLFERQDGRGSVVICNHTSMPSSWPWRRRCSLGGAAFVPSLSPSSPRARLCAGPLAALAASPWSVVLPK